MVSCYDSIILFFYHDTMMSKSFINHLAHSVAGPKLKLGINSNNLIIIFNAVIWLHKNATMFIEHRV